MTAEAILAMVAGMGNFRHTALQILANHGIEKPEPGQWHPQQSWLNAFSEIAEKISEAALTAIGMKIPDNALWPPGHVSIHEGLASIDVAYHMNHRGGEIGHYHYASDGEREGIFTCDNPYPCPFDQGIIRAMAGRHLPADLRGIILEHAAGECRSNGDDRCIYRISW